MDNVSTVYIWTLWLFVFTVSFIASYPEPPNNLVPLNNPSIIKFTYSRYAEIEKQCSSILSSASELNRDDNRAERIKNELSFLNGDWDQDTGGSPLISFSSYSTSGSIYKLVSFWVIDVDPIRTSSKTVSFTALLKIGLSTSIPFSDKPSDSSPNFEMQSESSSLTILFEGIYIESEKNGGNRLMCMLGNTKMPDSSQSIDSRESMSVCRCDYQPPFIQDDQIMLVLNYPKAFTLTTSEISGELKSLNENGDLTYFDKVHISSQFGKNSNFQFGSQDLVSKACNPYPYQDKMLDEEVSMFKGDGFCSTLQNMVLLETFNLVSNWKSFGINAEKGKLGPFILDPKTKIPNGGLENFRLIIQKLHCEPGSDHKTIKTAKVYAVFRVIYSWDGEIYRERTGVSGMTLSAEGIWNSSFGQLCMVGCIGIVGPTSEICNSRICLYIPIAYSLKQRSVVFGTISSINESDSSSSSSSSLIFEKVTDLDHIKSKYSWNGNLKWSYNYSRTVQASDFQKRTKPSKLRATLKKSFLLFPSLDSNDISSHSRLSDELSLQLYAVKNPILNSQTPMRRVELEVISLGSFFQRHWHLLKRKNVEFEKILTNSDVEELEISGHFGITGGNLDPFSLFLEGLYNPLLGEMYLIGCRDLRSSQKFINNGTNLERGMDCLIEVKIEYFPKNVQWVINPKVKISIKSQRSEKDHLYIKPINVEAVSMFYNMKLDDRLFRMCFEGVLHTLMLIVATMSILSQSVHTVDSVDSTIYVSVVMLAIQALGYGILLITGGESLFNWREFENYRYQTHQVEKFQRFQVLDYAIKVLLFIALLLTLRLSQKVWESRKRKQSNLVHGKVIQVPDEKKVLLITLAIHLLGFTIFHGVHKVKTSPMDYMDSSTNFQILRKWVSEMELYGGLVQDFFLLPQIVCNIFWKIQGKPLRKIYYFGFTLVRLLMLGYSCASDPVPNPRFVRNEIRDSIKDVKSEFWNVITGSVVLIVAVIVYIQQRDVKQKSSRTVKLEEKHKV